MPRPFRRPTRTVNETVHGIPVSYDIPDTTPLPRLPFNLDATLRRILFTVAVVMTLVAIIWSTVAIGGMLALLAPAWAAYLVAGVFDAGWAACLIAEWILRSDSRRAQLPMRVGAGMLAVSMAAITTHGALSGSWGWIIGIVGALASAAAKGVWAIGMHTIRIKLDPKYEAYLRTLQQQTGTEQALALAEWDRARTQDRTAKLRLALEARRPTPSPVVEQIASTADPAREPIATTPEPAREHIANTSLTSEITDREQPSIADLAREQVAITTNNTDAVDAILRARPEASKPSVAAAVRRARKASQGPYL